LRSSASGRVSWETVEEALREVNIEVKHATLRERPRQSDNDGGRKMAALRGGPEPKTKPQSGRRAS
jgi:hypothetical protein